MNHRRFLELFWEFNEFIMSLQTLYLDSLAGFSILHERIFEYQDSMKALLGDRETASEEFQNECGINYKDLCPHDFTVLLSTDMKQGDVKSRTARNGRNYILTGRLCVVSAYTYWEEYLRREIGIALGILSQEVKCKEEIEGILSKHVKSNFWGDMNWLRQSIIHKQGVAISKVTKCKILKWFNPGDQIDLDFDKMWVIFYQMGCYRNQLHTWSLRSKQPLKIPIF